MSGIERKLKLLYELSEEQFKFRRIELKAEKPLDIISRINFIRGHLLDLGHVVRMSAPYSMILDYEKELTPRINKVRHHLTFIEDLIAEAVEAAVECGQMKRINSSQQISKNLIGQVTLE